MRRIAAPVVALVLSALPAGNSLASAPAAADAGSPTPIPSAPPMAASAVVDASRLLTMLPEPPAGWSADKPEGTTSDSTGFPLTTVSRVYYKGNADDAPTAAIHIIDSANNQQFQDATKAMWSVTSNTAQGYDKAVTVDGLPGFEHFANADQTGVLWVAVAGRFFVQVETTKQPAEELQGWIKRIDLNALGTMK